MQSVKLSPLTAALQRKRPLLLPSRSAEFGQNRTFSSLNRCDKRQFKLMLHEEFMGIRRFKNGDEIALFRIFFSAVHVIASRHYTQEQIEAWAPADIDPNLWANHMRSLRPFVAEVDGEIVGYADIQPNGYIDHFFVSGTYPRQGVGTLLMNRIHEEANLLGIDELTADVSKTAEPLFVLHGFHVVEQRFPIRRGVTLQNALMRKKLAHGT